MKAPDGNFRGSKSCMMTDLHCLWRTLRREDTSADSGEPEWKESGEFHRESEFGTFSEVQNPEEIKAVRIAGKEYFTVG